MHICGDGADHRVEGTREDAVSDAVSARYGTESRGKGEAVDIRLSRERPRNIEARDKADGDHRKKQRDISEDYGKDVPRVLTVCGKGQGGENDAYGWAREADTHGERGKDVGNDKYKIQISENTEAVHRKVYHTKRHSELIGEIYTVSRGLCEDAISLEAVAVENDSEQERQGEEDEEEDVHKSAIGIRQSKIIGIVDHDLLGVIYSECSVHKGVDEYAENAYGKPRLI